MKCNCQNGKVFAFINRGEDYRTHTQEWITCTDCNGSGEIPDIWEEWGKIGEKLRKKRFSLDFSMHKLAQLLGCSSVDVSKAELGKIDPSPYLLQLEELGKCSE